MLRRKQSFTRYSIVSIEALRVRYCGYRAEDPDPRAALAPAFSR